MPAIDPIRFCRTNPARLVAFCHQPPGVAVHLLDLLIVGSDP
jgi:hypothetical protein